MAGLASIVPNAEVLKRSEALAMNARAAKGLAEVLASNLGPKGSVKMLVSGAGEVKITKDGAVLLSEMQIQHPTAILIARTANAQDDVTGDGTTSAVLFTGALLDLAYEYVAKHHVHVRFLAEGYDLARVEAMKFLETYARTVGTGALDRETLVSVARTSLRTKLMPEMADQLTEMVTDAVLLIRQEGAEIDLNMVERMHMLHRTDTDSRLVRGLVLDHGSRHPDMPVSLKKCYVMVLNVSLEYEKTEDTSTFVYSTAEERERLVAAERRVVDEKVDKIIRFKREVCTEENGMNFVIINQKGIDPLALDKLAKERIIALRRAKRRNMERLTLACGGVPVNSVDDLTPECLGMAGHVYEQSLGEEKYTFVEDVANPQSCTILLKGPNAHTIAQLQDAVRDGLRAVKNAIDDEKLVPGAGAFEVACSRRLRDYAASVRGNAKFGIECFADALLVIPKTLASNSGLDVMATLTALQETERAWADTAPCGLDLVAGKPFNPAEAGVWDNLCVKRQSLQLGQALASQLLLVDEVLRAGRGARNE